MFADSQAVMVYFLLQVYPFIHVESNNLPFKSRNDWGNDTVIPAIHGARRNSLQYVSEISLEFSSLHP